MPPPYGWRVGVASLDAAGRMAWRRCVAVDLFTNVLVIALSHLALRGARRCPSWARSGADLSAEQRAAATSLRSLGDEYLGPCAPDSDRGFRSA